MTKRSDCYQPEKDNAGLPPVGSESGIPDVKTKDLDKDTIRIKINRSANIQMQPEDCSIEYPKEMKESEVIQWLCEAIKLVIKHNR